MVPPREHGDHSDTKPTLERYAKLFDLGALGEEMGYPLFMKPYDGGAWEGVTRIDDSEQLKAAYATSGKRVMHLQEAIDPFDVFAPVAVIEGAGGIVTDWSGKAIDLAWQGRILAAGCAEMHEQAMSALAGHEGM